MPQIFSILILAHVLWAVPASGQNLEIAQPLSGGAEYQRGLCNHDAAEVVEQMAARPGDFDVENVRVLMMSNVQLGKHWAFHFAVYDGKGHVYDPGLAESKTIPPVRLREYFRRVINLPEGRTQIRTLKPARFLEINADKDQLRVFYLFASGMANIKSRRQFDVNEADWNELAPLQTPSTIARWLSKGQFEPWTIPDLPANVHTIFPNAKNKPNWFAYGDPKALLRYCKRRSTLPETIAAASWAWLNLQETEAYFALVLKHERHFPRERMDKFNLDRVFRETQRGRAWMKHDLRAFFRSCEGPLSS